MNPNLLNNFTPEQMKQFQNMVTPEMMKGMTNQLSMMNDDQLRGYLSSMGMGHISPQMFRSASQNMSNLSDNDLNNMKTMNANKVINNSSSSLNSSAFPLISTTEPKNIVEKLEWIKAQGNNLYKQNKHTDACSKYYEVINEIALSSEENANKYKEQFHELERVSRLNIANCKLILKDYDVVINECLKVLEKNNSFKAYYRLGIALLKKHKSEKALEYLNKAKQIGNYDEKKAVELYINECHDNMSQSHQKTSEKKETVDMGQSINDKTTNDNLNCDLQKNVTQSKTKLDRMEEMLQQEKNKNNINKKSNNDIEEEEEIKIETIENKSKDQPSLSSNHFQYPSFNNNNNFNIHNQEQAQEKLKSMSDSELSSMMQTMKSMDNETIASMLKAQGMSFSNQDIEFMKNAMTPETLKMMKDSNMQMPSMNIPNRNETISNASSITPTSADPPSMPNLGNMDYKSMLNFIKGNPEMMKMISPQLSQLIGGKEGNPEIVVNAMEKIFWVLSLPSEIKKFCKSKKGICIIILLIALIYSYFFKK